MKKIFILVLSLFCFWSLTSCNGKEEDNVELVFTQHEYKLRTGEAVALVDAPSGVIYEIINNEYSGVNIDSKTGVVTFEKTIPNYSQIPKLPDCLPIRFLPAGIHY